MEPAMLVNDLDVLDENTVLISQRLLIDYFFRCFSLTLHRAGTVAVFSTHLSNTQAMADYFVWTFPQDEWTS